MPVELQDVKVAGSNPAPATGSSTGSSDTHVSPTIVAALQTRWPGQPEYE